MIDFNYDTIYELYKSFFDSIYLQNVGIFLKFIAVSFFLLNVYTNMFQKMGGGFGSSEMQLPYDKNKIIGSLAMVLILAFYDKVLFFLDEILMSFDSSYSQFSPLDFVPTDEEITDDDVNFDALSTLKSAGILFIRVATHPSHIVVLILEGISWIIDSAIYAVFLIERFFFIGVLKILGSIAIVMAVFDKQRHYFFNWLKLYIAIYLLIIPFFLVIGFASHIFDTIDAELLGNSGINAMIGTTSRSILLLTLIWTKLRLFKKSYELVYKIFT